MKPKEKKPYVNALQARHLKDRLQQALRNKLDASRDADDKTIPANVRHARDMVKRYDRVINAYHDKNYDRIRAKEEKIRAGHARVIEKILFAEPAAALAMVKAYEDEK